MDDILLAGIVCLLLSGAATTLWALTAIVTTLTHKLLSTHKRRTPK